MENKHISEQELTKLFANDAKGIAPESSVQERLEYAYLVKSATYKTTQNSFLGMFTSFFSWSHLPAKLALASVVIIVSLMNIQPQSNEFLSPGVDTTLNTIPLRIDTAGMLPFFGDTCLSGQL